MKIPTIILPDVKSTGAEQKLIPLTRNFGETQKFEEKKRKADEELDKELLSPDLPPYTEKRWNSY